MIFILLFVIILFDQASKFIFNKILPLNQTLPVIKGFFHLTLVRNSGVAFGLLKDKTPLFIFTSLVAIVLIIMALRDKKTRLEDNGRKDRIYRIALVLILGGGLSNLIDRISLGYVIDFIDFRIWPVFNIADSAITIGAVVLAYAIFKSNGK